jgi:aspartate-semialdehyde dehydrogenase
MSKSSQRNSSDKNQVSSAPLQTRLGILGASTLIGAELLNLMNSSEILPSSIRLFDSYARPDDYSFVLKGEELALEKFTKNVLNEIDVLVALDEQVSANERKSWIKPGLHILDLGVDGLDERDNRIILPRSLSYKLTPELAHLSLPTSQVAQLVPVLEVLKELAPIKSIYVTGLESVSGAGQSAVDELWSQGIAVYNQKEFQTEAFEHQIAYNCIPQVGLMCDDGYSREEKKISYQIKHLLQDQSINVESTLIRVPLFYCSCQSISIQFAQDMGDSQVLARNKVVESLQQQAGLKVYENYSDYPMPLEVVSTSDIHIGRIRLSSLKDLSLWIVADNIQSNLASNLLMAINDLTGFTSKYNSQ